MPPPPTRRGSAVQNGTVLATWHELLDAGRMSDGDENLAGTAKPARALISATTAARAGVAEGQLLTVSTERGAVTRPGRDRRICPTTSCGCRPMRAVARYGPASGPSPETR